MASAEEIPSGPFSFGQGMEQHRFALAVRANFDALSDTSSPCEQSEDTTVGRLRAVGFSSYSYRLRPKIPYGFSRWPPTQPTYKRMTPNAIGAALLYLHTIVEDVVLDDCKVVAIRRPTAHQQVSRKKVPLSEVELHPYDELRSQKINEFLGELERGSLLEERLIAYCLYAASVCATADGSICL